MNDSKFHSKDKLFSVIFQIILSLVITIPLSAFAQGEKVSITIENVSLKVFLVEIEKKTDIRFSYLDINLDLEKNVSINVKDEPIEAVLVKVLHPRGLEFSKNGKTYAIKKAAFFSSQQPKEISGIISDNNGEPLIGVSIVIKNTTTGVITDHEGRFTLQADPKDILTISYVGYDKQEIPVKNKTNFTITLVESSQLLDEVVVVGYGVQKKKLITGATVQVKGDNLSRLSTISPLTALQSQTPGVQITQMSGKPGADFKIVIRGIGTIGDYAPLVIVDGVVGGDLNILNPNDIESVDILKDAASAAIYGSRAANGVILITTKQGEKGKTTTSYDGYFGLQNPSNKLKMVGARDYMTFTNEQMEYSGLEPVNFQQLLPRYDDIMSGKWNGTDWNKEFTNKNALVQNHSVGITGGASQNRFSLGFSYTSQNATFGNPSPPTYERYTARINSEFSLFQLNYRDIIKFGENLTYTAIDEKHGGLATGNIYSNDIIGINGALPISEVYDKEGNFAVDPEGYDSDTHPNPIALYYYQRSQGTSLTQRIQGNIYLEISPVKDLKFRTTFNLLSRFNNSRSYSPQFRLSSKVFNNDDGISQSQYSRLSWQLDNILSYDLKIHNSHNIGVMAGQSVEKRDMGEELGGYNINSIFDSFEFAYLSNTKKITSGQTSLWGSPHQMKQIASFFGRVNYNFQEKYMVTFIFRTDGSSTFNRGHRWGKFPSLSAGWVATNESFMESTKEWLDFLKLRGSWGRNGNENVRPFEYLTVYSFNNTDYFFGPSKGSGITGAISDNLPNPSISWETSEQFDLGIDARFFSNRLGVAFDYYTKKTKDWLVNAPIPAQLGARAPYINGGEIMNKGVEIVFTWNDNISNFHYGVNLNLGFNKNKVTQIANKEKIITQIEGPAYESNSPVIYRAEVGYPVGYFLGYKTKGVFQTKEEIEKYAKNGGVLMGTLENTKSGDLIYENINGDDKIDVDDKTMIGNPNPDMILGLSLFANFKGFDFSITANGMFGHQNVLMPRRPGMTKTNIPQYLFNERWHGEGTSNRYPRLTSTANNNWLEFSDIYIENADYLRIQNITLGYDFKQILPKVPISHARVYISGQNLFTISGYKGPDPEVGWAPDNWSKGVDIGTYPVPKSMLVGVNIKF